MTPPLFNPPQPKPPLFSLPLGIEQLASTLWYFGTFNPIHNTHLAIAQAALAQSGAKQVVFVPTAHPPHRPANKASLAPFTHRLAMVQLALAEHPAVPWAVSAIEAHCPSPNYTIKTLSHLVNQPLNALPHHCFQLIMGSDALATLPSWHQSAQLQQLCTAWVAQRPNTSPITGLSITQQALTLPPSTISANTIRGQLASQQWASASQQLPASVLAYAQHHHLYTP
jgi:nicotinate-nucleotide adenylyltransferase